MNYEEKYNEALKDMRVIYPNLKGEAKLAVEHAFPELAESEDERIRKELKEAFEAYDIESMWNGIPIRSIFAWLEKQKENPKSADSIPSNCVSNAKCDDRWHKVTDSLPDNGRLVLAKDCLGNVLLARYDGENWEVNVYDNEDHYCHNSISKWCEIPSEKQKEQKPADEQFPPLEGLDAIKAKYYDDGFKNGFDEGVESVKPAEWSEEDEHAFGYISEILDACTRPEISLLDPQTVNDFKEWIKSLRPSWKPSENELAKKHLDGYCMGREDTLREMKDFIESHFNTNKAEG